MFKCYQVNAIYRYIGKTAGIPTVLENKANI